MKVAVRLQAKPYGEQRLLTEHIYFELAPRLSSSTMPAMITPAQFHAARILAKWSRQQLADAARLPPTDIEAIEERGEAPPPAAAAKLRKALQAAGIVFIPERGSLGAGVRLKFPAQTVKSLQRMENEGGPARDDDVA